MPMKEEIAWVTVGEGLPPELEMDLDDEYDGQEEDDDELVMTLDAEGTVHFHCYRLGGMWFTSEKGYEAEVEGEVVAWAQQPKGPAQLGARRN